MEIIDITSRAIQDCNYTRSKKLINKILKVNEENFTISAVMFKVN